MVLQPVCDILQGVLSAEHQQAGNGQPLLVRSAVLVPTAEFLQETRNVFVEPDVVRIAGRKAVPILAYGIGIQIRCGELR